MVKFKIDPEVVRLIAMITAFVQTVGATLALAAPGAVSATAVLVIVAVGGGLQAALASYAQGTQTNPPPGMVTEERAAEITQERELSTADPEPHVWPAEYTASGRATVGVVTRPDETSGLGV